MNYHFKDLVDIKMVESLLTDFCKLNGMSASLIDADGIPLIRACWQPVCLNFHRKQPELDKRCRQSDAYIQQHVITDSYFIYKCENGILEAVTPIIIDGKHLASLYKGQFFMGPVDLDFFRNQALKYGLNEEEYIEGIKQIPVYSKEQMNLIMSFFTQLAKLLTQMGTLKMAELEAQNNVKEKPAHPLKDISVGEKKLSGVVEVSTSLSEASFTVDEDGKVLEIYCQEEKILNQPCREFAGRSIKQIYRGKLGEVFMKEIGRTIASKLPQYTTQQVILAGKTRLIEGHTVPSSYIAAGKKTVTLLIKDITACKIVEKELDVLYRVQIISRFIEELINRNEVDDERVGDIAKTLGIDLSANTVICIITCDKFNYLDQEYYEKGICRDKGKMINNLAEIPNIFVWYNREGIGLLYQTGRENAEINATIIAQIKNKMLQQEGYLPVNIGISDPQPGVAGLKKAYQQAVNAATGAKIKAVKPISILQHRDAGIFSLLPNIYDKQSAEDFIRENIGKVIEYDRKKKGNLLATLEEIVSNASVADISKKMFLHPKSVIFRRKRIEKLLNINLNDFETRLALAMAIKLYKLYREKM